MSKQIIIDNGTYSIKYGSILDDKPKHIQNCIIKTNDKKIYFGNSLNSKIPFQDPSSLIIKRPIENGQLTQWFLEKQIWDDEFDDYLYDSDLIYMETPVTFTKFQNMTDQVLFEEYGVNSLYRCSSASLVPWYTTTTKSTYNDFQLVIDSGFESTWVIPMVFGIPYTKGIKKMNIGGKFLNGYLREVISFRHYNVMDELLLVNDIKEKVCYISDDYDLSLKKIKEIKEKKTPKDSMSLNYILPDHKDSNYGYTLTNEQLSNLNYMDSQILKLSDERFSIPEVLFQPQLSGVYKSGIVKTIQESLNNIPDLLKPLLCANVACIGGNFNIPGFKERLTQELNKVIPINDEIKIFDNGNLDNSEIGWFAAKSFFNKNGFEKVCITKKEYDEFGPEYTQEKFGYKMS
ncbi:hypothetical protein CANARDRAFT_107451 [[Candida] arabinofermentans NRRL YB-2248]|uniref:Actin-like protein ARP6 n=1 Tax=[Candida] arabinofermentans NRRL YB-2248 TaxID=983967 RepID=A0A1E4SU01_9ASCO|nr:hypothetical protein CANARDRAFT_107451 [[Candida] arabinofermentans NRRL YB-2248]